MPELEKTAIKLRRISIKNFKAFDSLEIEFPPPRMKADPDIIVMGSKNGLGKTSVLEACALLFWAGFGGQKASSLIPSYIMSIDLKDILIRAGSGKAIIEGTFVYKNDYSMSLVLDRETYFEVMGNLEPIQDLIRRNYHSHDLKNLERLLFSLMAINSEPLILPPLLYFHSFRKIQEGNPELGMIAEGESHPRKPWERYNNESQTSKFKLEILRLMMSKANLFEDIDDKKAQEALDKLNQLIEKYAGGKIAKLRSSKDSTIEFRIEPTGGGPSYTFDGLSSGQKEIISTFFLIWKYTKDIPGIILIDEPELHLNAEWHRDYIHQLHKLAPHNQYIIATHSEDVFSSVPPDRRILLTESKGEKNGRG
ncbi:MAG: AAA family ATPase [Candidatus Eremiobacteraeota bacterium]|nr:AAA family ATPase [Candidatus Eremiobacteraeota bacterium]